MLQLRRPPTCGLLLTVLSLFAPRLAARQLDVPLSLWTNADFPNGFALGPSFSASFGDYDGDGWSDLLAMRTGSLWHNDGGTSWSFAADLKTGFLVGGGRYGAAWGDFDLDGRPDVADEPRANACLHLLRNFGGGRFRDFATLPQWVTDPACGAQAETNVWGDVDGDFDLDLMVPIYPPWGTAQSIGNRFYKNAGPGGTPAFHLEESTVSAGLENAPPDSARPEGADLADLDGDGDLDLYCGGTLYQNRSTVGAPRFEWMTELGSGIGFHDLVDEGAAFGDHDMDGDQDIFIAYIAGPPGVRIWENRGDGTFFFVGQGVIESPGMGLLLGLSVADWDNDGDLDFTTRNIFRRNMLLETGVRRFEVATHAINPNHIDSASPAWADWDKDGDLDALMGFHPESFLYENTTYVTSTPAHLRRFVRVKLLNEFNGTRVESEYGAQAEVRVHGEDRRRRRVRLCSSAAGYVNQNEYPLHFALPPDRTPDDPDDDLVFDLSVRFPTLPEQGQWRVDRSVNPRLGDIALADLSSHEIVVMRDGRVELNGVEHAPLPGASAYMFSVGGELPAADPQTGLAPPTPPPTPDHWVGIELDTSGATHALRLRELVLEGQLGPAVDCGGGVAGNVLVFDVSGSSALLLPGGALRLLTSDRNRRSFLALDLELETDHRYRVVARVSELRLSPMSAPAVHPDVRLTGALDFAHPGLCPAAQAFSAPLVTNQRALTVRVSPR